MYPFEMQTMENFLKEAHKVINDGGKIVCFGASSLGERALKCDFKNIDISYFCDNDTKKRGISFLGLPVFGPEKLREEKNILVIITSLYISEITEQLRSMGIDNIWHSLLITLLSKVYDRQIIDKNKSIIDTARGLFFDEQSTNIFKTIIKHRQTQNLDLLCDIVDDGLQYFKKDIFEFSAEEVYVDAGAFTGDTIFEFKRCVDDRFHKIYAFEPDDTSFSSLGEAFKNSDDILLFKKGLYDTETKIGFNSDNGIFSGIDDNLDFQIETCRLDDVVKEKVTFIKMDIEGSELKALEGAKEIILRDRPKLAICVYHKPADLWEIPLWIKKLVPEYKLYLRQHLPVYCDTVLYATI